MRQPPRKIEFELPRPPRSKKNNKVPRRSGRRIGLRTCIVEQEADIKVEALKACSGNTLPLWPEEDISVWVRHDIVTNRVRVTVEPMGRACTFNGRTGRGRDIQNLPESILDALQRIVYRDDRQVAHITICRVVPEEKSL